MKQKELLDAPASAKFIHVSLSGLYKLCLRKEIRYYRLGRRSFFAMEDLLEFIERRRVPTIEELKEQAEERFKTIKRSK